MNTKQKIILTIWVSVSFVLLIFMNLFITSSATKNLPIFIFSEVAMFFLISFIVGVPTFILYKIWADKKNNR
jgi:pilus assembly protein TadC